MAHEVEPRTLTLAGHGGEPLEAHLWRPAGEARAGVVLIHEVFGLDAHMRGVARRLARAGFLVLAPDLYSRGGLPGPAGGPDDPAPPWSSEQIRSAVAGLSDRVVLADLEACAAAVVEAGVDPERVAAWGFCMGGNYAFLLGCTSTRVHAVVDFYGRVVYPELSAAKPVQPLEMALNLGAPLLALFGEQDPAIPTADVQRMEAVLSQFAKDFAIVTYPEAGHGFFNDLRPGHHAPAAEDAWRRALAFLDQHLL